MNSNRATLGLALVAAMALATAGCAKPPTTEIEGAEAVLSGAKAADASSYAQQELTAAEEAMATLQTELEAQNEKLAVFRSYGKTKELVEAAATAAKKAEEAAVEGKRKAFEEAVNARDAARAAADRVQELLAQLGKCPRKPKGFSKDLELLRGAADGLQSLVAEIDQTMNEEKFLAAIKQAESVQISLDELIVDLDGARTKIGC
jgi:hypothetical protein